MSDASDSTNTGHSQDATGHKWNFHFASEDAARKIIAHIIATIYGRKDLNGPQKDELVRHLAGIKIADMKKVIDDHFGEAAT